MRRRFVVASVVDAVGSGLWMPFALLFLVHAQGIPLVEAGAGLSAGALIGLVTLPALGAVIDRAGPVNVLILSNVIRLLAFVCYPLVSSAWLAALVAVVTFVGDRLFFTANTPLVNSLTEGRGAERLLGTQTIGRFAGSGIGAGATAFLPPVVSPTVYHLLAYANAASFAVAALLIAGMRVRHSQPALALPAEPGARWGHVLRHRGYLAFCATHALLTLASVSKYAILPILVLDVLHGPQWTPGVAIAIGTLVIVFGQQPIIRYAARWSRARGLITAALCFATAFAALAVVGAVPVSVAVVVILSVSAVTAVAEAIFAPIGTAAAAAAAPLGAQGRASALFQMSWSVSQVAGPVLLTSLLSVGNPVLWLTLTLTCLLVVPCVIRLRANLAQEVLA